MKIKDFLSKSGVLRSGAVSATYKSAKDRPTELLMDDVYNEKKDVITKEEVNSSKKVLAGTIKAKNKPTKGRKIFFWATVAFALLLFIAYIGSGSFGVIIFGTLLIAGFILFVYKFAFAGLFAWWLVITIFIFFIIFGLILVPSDSKSDSKNATSSTPAASYDELKQYDKKVVIITSTDGKLTGTAGMTLKKDSSGKPYLDTYYNMFINETLPKNGGSKNGIQLGNGYDYVNNLVDPTPDDGEGVLSAIHCNKEAPVSDPYSSASRQYDCNGIDVYPLATDKQLATFSNSYRSYDAFLKKNTFEIYDASSFWEEKKEKDGMSTWSIDDDLVVAKGQKIRTYNLQFK